MCKIKKFIFIILLFISFTSSPLFSQSELKTITTNFNSQRGTILIQSELPTSNCFFLLDTGVSIPAIDNNCQNNIIKDEYKVSAGNPLIKNVNLNSASFPVYHGDILLSNLSNISNKLGVCLCGIIPIYFPGYEIYIDFGNEKITWRLISTERKREKEKVFYEKLYFSPEQPIPQVPVTLNSKISLLANIDFVRSENIGIPMNIVNEKKITNGKNKFARYKDGKVVQYFRLKTLRIGNQNFENLLAVSVPGEKNAWIGTHFWRKSVIHISYEEAKLHLLKTGNYKEEIWTGIGIIPDYLSEQGWIIGVIEDTPAWNKANLRGGECLQKINDFDVKNIKIEHLIQLLNSKPGTVLDCTFINQVGSEIKTPLTAEEIL